ncbi:sensor histidine kinase, partial [Streptomyces sp. NPDC003015]
MRHGASAIHLTAAVRDGRLRLAVVDEGAGFPPGFLPQAFDRFSRAEASRTTPGSGLGLAFVAAAASHDGIARAENTERGTVVTIEIPCGPPFTPTRQPCWSQPSTSGCDPSHGTLHAHQLIPFLPR